MTNIGFLEVTALTMLCYLFAAEANQTCAGAGDSSNLVQLGTKQRLELDSKLHSRQLGRRESPGTLLNDVAFLEAHDAGTGLGVTAGAVTNQWAQTQQGSLATQLNCGARALDLRLAAEDGKVYFHHSKHLAGAMDFQTSMQELVEWAGQHPTELVVLYVNHCQSWDGTHRDTDCGQGDFFINAVQSLGINIVPGLMGASCKNANGTAMTYASAKELARLPGGGMLLAIFQNTATSNCVNENFNQASDINWGTGGGLSSEDESCPYLGTANSFFHKWTALWNYARSILGVDPQGKMHETQLMWQETGTSGVSQFFQGNSLLTLNEKSNINEAVYKQIQTGFLPADELNLVKMNNICRWGPEISRLLGAVVSNEDATACNAACSTKAPVECSSADLCCGDFNHDCCGSCRCVATSAGPGLKCTISGESDGSSGPCDGICHYCSDDEANTAPGYQTWGNDGGTLTFCPQGYEC